MVRATSRGSTPKPARGVLRSRDRVFVVHGRIDELRADMFRFLEALGLHPMTWPEVLETVTEPTPFVGQAIRRALTGAQAVLVLFTPDDLARLRKRLQSDTDDSDERTLTVQPRPNVLLEAGMGFGHMPDRTVLVSFGRLRQVSDLLGRHICYFDGSAAARRALVRRLRQAGCQVTTRGGAYLRVGKFSHDHFVQPLWEEVFRDQFDLASSDGVILSTGAEVTGGALQLDGARSTDGHVVTVLESTYARDSRVTLELKFVHPRRRPATGWAGVQLRAGGAALDDGYLIRITEGGTVEAVGPGIAASARLRVTRSPFGLLDRSTHRLQISLRQDTLAVMLDGHVLRTSAPFARCAAVRLRAYETAVEFRFVVAETVPI